MAFIVITPVRAGWNDSRRMRREGGIVGRDRGRRRCGWLAVTAAGCPDEAMGAVERARRQLDRQEPRPLVRARQRKSGGRNGGESELAVVGRIADQQDRAMAEPLR